jgi:peptide/nickel transport system substrate-binding protein
VVDGTYWDKAAGLLKKMTWIYLPTAPQRMNAVRSGDVDLAQVTGVDTYPASQLIKTGEYKGRAITLQTTQLSLMLRATRPPLDNKTFRQAISYAIDKQALSKGLYNGDCDPVQQFYTSRHWAHSATVDTMFRYDHDKAQQMVKQSGLFNPTFTVVYGPLYEAPAQALQGMLGDYGINVKLQPVAGGDLSFRDGQADAFVSTVSPNGGLEPSTLVNQYYIGIYNLLPDSDGAVAKAAAAASDPTISQAQAAKLYDGIWQKAADAAVVIPLCNTHQVWFQKGKVANLNDLGLTFSGRVDPRYLYVKK